MPEKIDTLYICDWLPPDFGAVGQYSLIFARSLATEGRSVVLGGLSSRGHEKVIEPYGKGQSENCQAFGEAIREGQVQDPHSVDAQDQYAHRNWALVGVVVL